MGGLIALLEYVLGFCVLGGGAPEEPPDDEDDAEPMLYRPVR